jgi:hypothetical protein
MSCDMKTRMDHRKQRQFFAEVYELLRKGGLLLISEPAGHIDKSQFDRTFSEARIEGFGVVIFLDIRWSRSAVLEKRANPACLVVKKITRTAAHIRAATLLCRHTAPDEPDECHRTIKDSLRNDAVGLKCSRYCVCRNDRAAGCASTCFIAKT